MATKTDQAADLSGMKEVFEEVQQRFQSKRESFNALLMGDAGTGKTYSLRTAKKPVLIHSFDPGGHVSLREVIGHEQGIFVDNRFQQEDPVNPTAYRLWEDEFHKLRQQNFFDHVGTYVIDSITTWSEALMNEILKQNGRKGRLGKGKFYHGKGSNINVPELRDYMVQMRTIGQELGICCALNCDFIAIAHIETTKDEVTGRVETGPMVTGKLSQRLPLLFDEIYVALAEGSGDSTKYQWLTAPDGRYMARSRLASSGKIKKKIDPNWTKLMSLAGLDHKDLEW